MCDTCCGCACCKPYLDKAKYTQCHMTLGCNWPPSANIQIFDSRYLQIPRYDYDIHKILILGSGDVGKSAVFKSIKRTVEGPLTDELSEGRHVIRQNLIAGILTLLKKSQELYDVYNENFNSDQKYNRDIIHNYEGFADKNLLKCLVGMDDYVISNIQLIVDYGNESFSEVLNYNELKQLGVAIDSIWNMSAVQQTFLFRLKRYYSFPANMDFFFDKSIEIMCKTYTPNEEDAWKLKVRTTGMIQYEYEDEYKNKFEIRDVGGERNERKKWIHHFESVSCVLYVSALNQYCKSLFEDEKQIGLLESMQLFYEICNSKWFKKSVIVLLLNKTDLFRRNLKITSLKFCFGDEYKGRNFNDKISDVNDVKATMNFITKILMYFIECGVTGNELDNSMNNIELNIPRDIIYIIGTYFDISELWLNMCYQDGIEFITKKFMCLNIFPNREIYVYEVVAIEPEQIGKIMKEVQQIIIESRESRFAQFV